MGSADHRGDVLQVALRLYHLPNVGTAPLEAVGLVRRLQYFSLLCRGDQPGVDVQGYPGPLPQPLKEGLLLGGGGVSPHCPNTAEGIAHHIAVHLEPDGGGGDEVQKGLEDLGLLHDTGGLVVALVSFEEPSLTVEIIVSLGDNILGKVDRQNALDVLVSGPAGSKALLPDHLLQPGEIGVHLPLPDVPGANDKHKLPGGGGAALYLVQMPQVLVQQGTDGGALLLLHPAGEIPLVMLETFTGVEAEQFHLHEALEDVHEGVDSCPQALSGQHRHIGGLEEKQHDLLSLRRDDAMLGDPLHLHQGAGAFSSSLCDLRFRSPPYKTGRPSDTAGASR